MCGQGGVKYRSWYMAQLTYSSLSCYVCNGSSNKALAFKKNQLIEKFFGVYKNTEGPILCPKDPNIGPYFELEKSSSHAYSLFI
jgi:hypothetical protein